MTPIARTPYPGIPTDLADELRAAGLDPRAVHEHVAAAVDEDLPGEDVTTEATVPVDAHATADLVARADGVVAGLPVAELVLWYVAGPSLTVERAVADGQRVTRGQTLLTASGPTGLLLTGERTALNYLCHLSGVATATAAWVDALEGSGAAVRDTRKTLPHHRALQKYAVRCGGGVNHRATLSDQALVKDNHVVAAGGVVPAFEAVRRRFPSVPVQVEVTTLDQLREVLAAGATEVLLDNMDVATMAEAVAVADGRARLEASGGLDLARAREVAVTGVDFLAVGALTHSAAVLDVAMDLRPAPEGEDR
jgi:nicotinate-nucleotide pyrophosphorylase (carboxylating)